MNDRQRRLLWHGTLLFLLGLFTGLAEPQFTNIRMGLAAHLEGVMNGTFLIAVGAAWPLVRLGPRSAGAAFGLLLYGTYANWLVTTLAAVFGTAALSPISAAGHTGAPWQETFITLGFASVGVAIIAAAVLLLVGFRRAGTSP